MTTKIKTGIIGAAGYTGGELTRLLLGHPAVEIGFAQSRSQAGKPLWLVHGDLLGDTDMLFSSGHTQDADVIFLCLAHGEAKKFLAENHFAATTKIIDLSHDFRLHDREHDFVYGLPELQRGKINAAVHIANPGCFATAIQLALLPAAAAGLLQSDIHISATTGSTGAGQSLSPSTHYSWRNGNISAYKALHHQHLAEIGQSLEYLQPGFSQQVHFIPYRGSFTRGILAGVYFDYAGDFDALLEIYRSYYLPHPFTFLSGQPVDIKQVVNTNKCLLHIEQQGEKIFVTSVIDNLLKGASGQAVQNMNLAFGLEETLGLKLKAVAF
ncbi:MAG: N-acetyl-gamma-glutamyl-phosphate reductase, common form [Bacteroidetes bacterium]|nr:MAG: N-acetyl-gamma-glutamyl-phosphate reductase, common form [Bacteroidota bacterium]